ncbi:MAG: hypothetical protein ABI855_06550 [Bacteroidota bacterium]
MGKGSKELVAINNGGKVIWGFIFLIYSLWDTVKGIFAWTMAENN